MDDRRLREILLNLHSRLSNNDRERLHFYLQNDVPRPLADDSSLNGTLKLMQSLFDQDKINETDFTLLIDAFQKIQCFDAAHTLKEHQHRMQLSDCSQSTLSLASIMTPSLTQEVLNDYEEDTYLMDIFPLDSIEYEGRKNKNKIINYSTDNIIFDEITDDPIETNQNRQALLSISKRVLWMPFFAKKYFFLPYILFLIALAALVIVVIEKIQRIHNLEENLQVKQNFMIKDQNKQRQTTQSSNDRLSDQSVIDQHENITFSQSTQENLQSISQLNSLLTEKSQLIDQFSKLLQESNQQQNLTMKQWTTLLTEKNVAIEQLNKTIIESQRQRTISLIKAGQRFGGNGGANFDDSLLPMFTLNHYVSGLIIPNITNLHSCQFIYTSPYENQSRIVSPIHGNFGHPTNSTYIYHLDENERIEEVILATSSINLVTANKKYFNTIIVNGFQFITTRGRLIPADIPLLVGDIKSERFPRYILGYVTGSTGLAIDQLQFMWYRTKK